MNSIYLWRVCSYTWRSEDTFRKLVLAFHHMGLRNGIPGLPASTRVGLSPTQPWGRWWFCAGLFYVSSTHARVFRKREHPLRRYPNVLVLWSIFLTDDRYRSRPRGASQSTALPLPQLRSCSCLLVPILTSLGEDSSYRME